MLGFVAFGDWMLVGHEQQSPPQFFFFKKKKAGDVFLLLFLPLLPFL
jgi:hypothetical protein